MVNNNNYKVEGAKAGDKPRQPNIAKDSVSSISTAKILYGLNDGEISGIVGGGKGIKLEDTPLLDEAGKENFKGVKWDFRAGTLDQEYIEGFPDISNETGVGVELKGGVDWIKAISNPVLSAVRIRLSWNGLRKQNIENGDVSGYKIDYAVDVKTGSGAYIEVLKTNINDKVTGKYERTHRIALPKSSSGWQIRVRRLTPNANLDNVQDKMFIESITEVIDQKFTYPHTSLLGIQYDAKTFSRIAKLAVRCKGKLIKIPSNYNSDANTYTGVWNGQFKLEYSNNPAWIFYDLVTSKRYGLGKRIDPSMVDKWSLYDLGTYCDALVPDGQGSTEKRYTCNVYLQSQVEAYQILSQLSGIFRAITYWSGQQLVLSADVPKDPTYTFSRANVIDGQFEYTGTRARDRHTVAKVAFDNPKENFKTEYEYIRDEAGIAKFGINVIDISAIGCTSRGQAQRAGLWALKSEQLETRTVTFRTGLEGFNLLVGEVIEVSDELLAGRANGGRITAVDSTLKGVTVDREAVIKVNDFITVNAKDGVSQRRKVVAVSGKVITVLTPFVEVEAGAVWAISSVDLNTMQFRVMSIKPDEDNIFAITAIQHEPLKYAAVDHGADVKPTSISIIKPTNVAPPASVGLSANYRVVQGQSVATLVIQWSQVKDAVGYSVEWRRNDGNWIKLPLTGNVSAEVEGVYEGNYQARVKSVNAFDVESDFTNSIVTNIKGKVGSPKALASITATGILFGMDIKWNFLAGSEDTNYTEIQTATDASGANTALLGSFSYPTDKTTVNGLQGGLTVFYRGRIVDKLGNFGDWSQWVSGTTDASADKVLDLLEGQITETQLYQDLRTKIDLSGTNALDISGVKADIAAANATLDKAKADILATDGSLATAKGELATAKTDITKAKTDIVEAKRVADLAKTDSEANKTTIANLTTTVDNNKTSVDSSITTLTNKDLALSNLYTALKSEYDTNKASVSQDLTTLTNKDISLSSLLTALDTDYQGNKTAIRNELTAVSTKTDSTANSLTSLTTEVGNNKTAITNEATTRSTEDTALSNRITTVSGKTDNALSRITTAETTIANNTGAITQQKTDITAAYTKAINDIEIGGRNLLLNSNKHVDDNKHSTLNGIPYKLQGYNWEYRYSVLLSKGTYTASVLVHNNGTTTNSARVLFNSENYYTPIQPNETKLVSNTFTLDTETDVTIYFLTQADTVMLFSYAKLEKGNKATDWTAAPEDIEAETKASVTAEALARSNADGALGNRITATDAIAKNAQARVGTVETAVANANSSIATLKTDITAAFNASDNLVLDSKQKFKNAAYLLAEYQLAKIPEVGLTYKLTLKGVSGAGRQLRAYSDGGGFQLGVLTLDSEGNYTSIFKWGYTYGGSEERLKKLSIYQFEPNLTTVSSVDSIELVRYAAAEEIAETKASVTAEATARSDADGALGNRITATDAIAKNAQARVGTVETSVANNTSSIAQSKTDITAAFKAVTDLSIGRNLLKDFTKSFNSSRATAITRSNRVTVTFESSSGSSPYIYFRPTEPLQKGITYTLSFYIYTENRNLSLIAGLRGSGGFEDYNIGITTTRTRITKTFIPTEDGAPSFILAWSGYDNGIKPIVVIEDLKVEEGNKATAYISAPEDSEDFIAPTSAKIATVEQAVATNKNAIASTQKDLVARLENIADKPNILVGGDVYIRSAEYLIKEYAFTSTPVEGKTYHCVIKGVLGADRDYFYLFNSGGAIGLCIMNDDGNGYYSGTFKWTGYYNGVLRPSTALTVYHFAYTDRFASEIHSITLREASSSELSQAAIQVSATATADKVTGLYAQYMVKLDVGGRISGFGLSSTGKTSDFAINADNFYIAPPTGSSKGTSPFMVLTTPTNINGTIVPSGTYIQSAFIHNGSIDNAKIGYAAIDNAKIKDLSITTGKIGLAQVDTLQIKGQAVSISSAVSKNKPSNLAEWCKGNGTVNEVSTIFEEISVDSGGASVILELYFYGTFVNVTNGSLTGSRVMVEFYGRDDSGNITQVQYFRFYRNYEELSTGFKAQFYPPNRNMNYYAKISCFGVSRIDSASYTFSVMTLKK